MTPERAAGPPTLLLFDIDGTLLRGATRRHREALHDAIRAVHGLDQGTLVEPPSPAGRTDGEIARLILRAAGVPEEEIDAGAEAVHDECCRIYCAGPAEDLRATVLPGVPELLSRLGGRTDVIVALLTGNFEAIARRKLAHAGIGEHFEEGAGGFGSDSEARADLPGLARRRSSANGTEHPRERTILIGDTPRDVACAQADEVPCIAVATGEFGEAELRRADWVAADMRAVDRLLGNLLQTRRVKGRRASTG